MLEKQGKYCNKWWSTIFQMPCNYALNVKNKLDHSDEISLLHSDYRGSVVMTEGKLG